MATLHQVTEGTKRLLVFLGVGVGILVCLILIFQIFVNVKNYFFPPQETPPTVAFGKLPDISFPQSTIDSHNFTYTLTTISGSLPQFPDQQVVYKIAPVTPNLLQFQRTVDLVKKIGFTTDPTALSDTQYQWTQPPSPDEDIPETKTLTYNIATLNFSLTSDYLTNASVAALPNLPDPQTAITAATSFLTNLNAYSSDIDESKTTTQLFKIENNALVSAASFSQAQFIQVSFFQKNVNNIPIMYVHTPLSSINVLLGGNSDVVAANYYHQTIDTTQHATYPIITAQQAFEQLKSGNTYIANYTGSTSNVIIRDVYLGYFVGESSQIYTLPVVVFQGDNNFFAYVPAITSAWLQK